MFGKRKTYAVNGISPIFQDFREMVYSLKAAQRKAEEIYQAKGCRGRLSWVAQDAQQLGPFNFEHDPTVVCYGFPPNNEVTGSFAAAFRIRKIDKYIPKV